MAFYLYTYKKPGLSLKMYLQESANKILENKKLQDVYGIDEQTLASVKSNISLVVEDIETNKKSYTEISWALGFIGGMLIYFFIFMYGAQVMRGVIEEKTSRIIEVIVSSVKPIQLMLGKIVGHCHGRADAVPALDRSHTGDSHGFYGYLCRPDRSVQDG